MRYALAAVGVVSVLTLLGCNVAPPPVEQPVPAWPSGYYPADYAKPLPLPDAEVVPPPQFSDPVIVEDHLPEEAWFLDVYNRVGRPRIALFVNRTLDGNTIPPAGAWSPIATGQLGTFREPMAPGDYPPPATVYLAPGQYDEAQLKQLDYLEMESRLSEWMNCNGKVTLLAPDFLRSQLSPQEIKDLQSGKTDAMTDLGQRVQADVLIQVQAHPALRQGQLVLVLVGEAINVPRQGRGGESLAHASVEMPAPFDRIVMNNYTRFLTRKLMHGMIGTWTGTPAPAGPVPPTGPVPATGTNPPVPPGGSTPAGPLPPLRPTTQPLPPPGN